MSTQSMPRPLSRRTRRTPPLLRVGPRPCDASGCKRREGLPRTSDVPRQQLIENHLVAGHGVPGEEIIEAAGIGFSAGEKSDPDDVSTSTIRQPCVFSAAPACEARRTRTVRYHKASATSRRRPWRASASSPRRTVSVSVLAWQDVLARRSSPTSMGKVFFRRSNLPCRDGKTNHMPDQPAHSFRMSPQITFAAKRRSARGAERTRNARGESGRGVPAE